jgi:hypothetical protein
MVPLGVIAAPVNRVVRLLRAPPVVNADALLYSYYLLSLKRTGGQVMILLRNTKINLMENNRSALWLIIVSQALILLSSLIDPPSGLLMVILRVFVPLIVVTYFSLILAGYVSPRIR